MFKTMKLKKRIITLLIICSIPLMTTLLMGYSSKEDLKFDLALNESLNKDFEKDPITAMNSEKFGDLQSQSQTEFSFFRNNIIEKPNFLLDIIEGEIVEKNPEYTLLNGEFYGEIVINDVSYPFNGAGEFEKFLINEEVINWAIIDIEMETLEGKDVGTLSMRYNESTNEKDVVITAGEIPNTAMLIFGEPFLNEIEINEILSRKGIEF